MTSQQHGPFNLILFQTYVKLVFIQFYHCKWEKTEKKIYLEVSRKIFLPEILPLWQSMIHLLVRSKINIFTKSCFLKFKIIMIINGQTSFHRIQGQAPIRKKNQQRTEIKSIVVKKGQNKTNLTSACYNITWLLVLVLRPWPLHALILPGFLFLFYGLDLWML